MYTANVLDAKTTTLSCVTYTKKPTIAQIIDSKTILSILKLFMAIFTLIRCTGVRTHDLTHQTLQSELSGMMGKSDDFRFQCSY